MTPEQNNEARYVGPARPSYIRDAAHDLQIAADTLFQAARRVTEVATILFENGDQVAGRELLEDALRIFVVNDRIIDRAERWTA